MTYRMKAFPWGAFALAAVVFLPAVNAFAQNTAAQITGRITDFTDAVIPGAVITVLDVDRKVERRVESNDVGYFRVPFLNPGGYDVLVEKDGFKPVVQRGITLEVAQVLRLDFVLELGVTTSRIEVTDAAALIQSETTEVGQVIDSKRILEMPLNGRNYLELATFAVGVLPSRELGKGTRHDGDAGGEGGILAVGMHAAQTNVLVDGADNSSRNSGGALGFQAQATKPSVDAVAEFKVVTNNMSAEYGYRMGAKVLVSTKSGTNQFHGSAFEFLRNDKLDGTNFFANRAGATKPTLRRNQFGATIGGPFVQNTLFGFFSWQSTLDRTGRSYTSSVPSADVRNGDFSQQPNPDREIYDPLTLSGGTRQPFPGFVIPASRFDPVSKAIVDLYPSPNITGRGHLKNNFFLSPSKKIDSHQYDMRVDWNIGNATRVFGRYSIRDEFVDDPGSLPRPADGASGQTVDLPGHNWAAAITTTFGPAMFNEVRFGYTHFPTAFDIPFTEPLNQKFGIKGAPGDTINDGLNHGFARFTPGGFSPVGSRLSWPNINNLDNLQLADSLSLIRNRHTLKVGVEYRRTNLLRNASRSRRGRFDFNGVFTAQQPNVAASRSTTGAGLADMLLGWASNGTYGWPNGEEFIAAYWGFFVQDDWRVTNRLTLNLGLRYELYGLPRWPDPDTHALNSTLSRFLTEVNGRPFGAGEGLSPGTPGAWGEAEFLPHFVLPKNGSDSGGEMDKNNFAPRVGIAFLANNRTVIRAGAGIFYGESDSIMVQAARFHTGPPFANEFTAPQPRDFSSLIVRDGFPAANPNGLPRAGLSPWVYQDGAWPQLYAAQWFFDIQRELGFDTLLTIGYHGSSTSHIPVTMNTNHPLTPHPTVRWQDRKARPFFTNVNLLGAQRLNANYNALTVKAEKRFTKGLTFLGSFTWSHNIDSANENLTQGTTAQMAFTYDRGYDRGNASLDRRLAFVSSAVYELPFGTGKPYLNSGVGRWILGDWQLGGLFSAMSGTPDSHTINADTTNVGGANRGQFVADVNLPRSERTIDRWFNTAAVIAGPLGQIDPAGRNMIWGPGRLNLDVAISRRFMMPWEGHSLQFRFESFNFTNTPAFGRPNTSFGTANAGRITTADEPRRIQFGLKYVF